MGTEGLSADLLSSWWFLSTHRGSGQASDSFHKTDWKESVQFETTSLQAASPELHEDRFPVLNCVVSEHFLVCLWIWWSWSGSSNDLRCPTLRLNNVSAWVDATILPCTRFTNRSCRLFSLVMDRGLDSSPALLNPVGFTLSPERWAT